MSTVSPCPVPGCRSDAGQPALTADAACGPCLVRLARAVAELPGLYVELTNALVRLPGGALDERVSYSPSPPLPLRVHVHDLGAELGRFAERLFAVAATRDRLVRRPGRARAGWTIQHASRAFAGRDARLLVTEGVAADLLGLVGRVRSTLGLTRLKHRLPAPCPDCDTLGLARFSGDDYVFCEQCGAWWSEADYTRLTVVLAHEVRNAR